MSSIHNYVTEMERLLRSHGKADKADLLKKIADTPNHTDFSALVSSLDVWGGEGSVVDVTLEEPNDERRYSELIVDLAEALDQLGIGNSRSRWVGQVVEDWLNAHPK